MVVADTNEYDAGKENRDNNIDEKEQPVKKHRILVTKVIVLIAIIVLSIPIVLLQGGRRRLSRDENSSEFSVKSTHTAE